MVTSSHQDLPTTGLLRLPQVLSIIPVGRSTWWAGVASGRFPAPVKLGPKTTCWRIEDIQKFLDSLQNNECVSP
jgi:prophage regulatory protein